MSDFKNKLMGIIRQHNPEVEELKNAEIPSIIHRTWLGKAMQKDTFDTLLDFQKHMKQRQETSYVHVLWVHSAEDADLKKQLHDLEQEGMVIFDMAQAWGCRPEIGQAIENRIQSETGNYVGYKTASDIFRMYILNKDGGIYMDADIGVREELFDEPVFHRFQFKNGGYMPLLGSMFPYVNRYEQAGGDIEVYLTFEHAEYMSREYGWNYFFASVPGNPVIEQMLQDVCETDGQTMTCNLVNYFYREIQEIEETEERKRGALFDYAFAPLDLQYCTKASDKC